MVWGDWDLAYWFPRFFSLIVTYHIMFLGRWYNRITSTTGSFSMREQRSTDAMLASKGRIAIVGIAESDSGRVPNMTELQLHAQAIQRALEDSGLRKQAIDGVFCSSDTMSMPTVTLGEYMQLFPRYTDSTSIGGASFEAHLHHAVGAIQTGKCQVALISYASNELSSRGRAIGSVNQPVTIP